MAAPPDDRTRERLINAAGEVFAEQGFHATTIRDICTKADANVAAVNYHFRDKMGLYVAVLTESLCTSAPVDVQAMVAKCRTPEEAHMQLLYAPYIPNRAEFLILANRRILADEMEFLRQHVSANSRVREGTHPAWQRAALN